MLAEYGITEGKCYDYAEHYLNVLEELKPGTETEMESGSEPGADMNIDPDYELMAYSNIKIDYEYIINLIQNIVIPKDNEENITPEKRQKKISDLVSQWQNSGIL